MQDTTTKPFTFYDFRTALLLAKTLDAIDILQLSPKTKASILFGVDHFPQAIGLLNSASLLTQTLKDGGKEILHIAEGVVKNYPQIPIDEAQASIKQFLATADIVDVHEPTSAVNTKQAVLDSMEYRGDFQSKRVLEALQSL